MSYVTIKNIGEWADLGSQIQQYSSLYAISKLCNKKVVFPESAKKRGWAVKFHKAIDVEIDFKPDEFFFDFVDYNQKDFVLRDEGVFNLEEKTNYNFTNIFHLYHYWYPKFKEDIFNIPWKKEPFNMAMEKLNSLKVHDRELVSMHVRRGDYLNHDHFCKLDTRYYGAALDYFTEDSEKYHYVVFSNDIPWCKESLIEGDNVTFVESGIDYVDIIVMSLCDHNVIANSSFSWWAAFKNKNRSKKVVCPKNYIRSYSPFRFLNGNYYPTEWQTVENDAS